uniref:Uncharacterized protein n=1 Tax=Cucumis sativus TaxID=3659 RepID=A0A0A0K8M8_CUCSA
MIAEGRADPTFLFRSSNLHWNFHPIELLKTSSFCFSEPFSISDNGPPVEILVYKIMEVITSIQIKVQFVFIAPIQYHGFNGVVGNEISMCAHLMSVRPNV